MELELRKLTDALSLSGYDHLVIADGSGTVNKPIGWSVTIWQTKTQEVRSYYGGASEGTNNTAELAPFCYALELLYSKLQQEGWTGLPVQRIALISDSELTIKCGRREYARNINLVKWAGIDWLAENGFKLDWLWTPRNSNPIGTEKDRVAKAFRKHVTAFAG